MLDPVVRILKGDGSRVPATVAPVFDRYPLVLSAAAGGLLVFAFPPYGLWPLAPLAVAMLSVAVHGRGAGPGAAAGLAFGAAFFTPLLSWTGIEVGAAPWLILAAAQAGYCAALGAALALVQRLRGWPVWVACGWVAQEWVRSRAPFGGFPWGRLAFSQPHTWFTPFAGYGGAPLVTFAVALCGALLAAGAPAALRGGRLRDRWLRDRWLRDRWLRGRRLRGPLPVAATRRDGPHRRPPGARVAVALAVAAVAVPLVGLAASAGLAKGPGGPGLTVAVVQGNVPRLGLDFNAQRAAVLDNHVRRTLELADRVRAGQLPRPAFVLWPENSSDIDPLANADARQAIDTAARAVGVPILVGAVLDGPGDRLRNAGIVWDPASGPGQTYIKRHPVPFGEYIPLRGLARLVSRDVDRVRHDFAAGTAPGTLRIGGQQVGDVICFEVAYDGLVRDAAAGSGLLVVQTNNATFDRSGETYQQLAMGQLRAVEYGRTVAVAATSGVSALIGPDGTVLQRSAVFTPDLLVGRVPVRTRRTLAARLGALPEWLASLAGLAATGWALAGQRLAAGRRALAAPAGGGPGGGPGGAADGKLDEDEDEETQTV
jgi:apolipoprotein N-acyltransferase